MTQQRAGRLLAGLILVAAMVTTPGCKSGGGDTVGAESAVRAYVDGLVPALAAQTLDPLRVVATPDQVDRVRLYVVQLTQQEGVAVQARLTSFEVVDASRQGDSAKVTTTEEWSYVKRDLDSGKTVTREDYSGTVEYSLVRDPKSNAWFVSSIVSELKR